MATWRWSSGADRPRGTAVHTRRRPARPPRCPGHPATCPPARPTPGRHGGGAPLRHAAVRGAHTAPGRARRAPGRRAAADRSGGATSARAGSAPRFRLPGAILARALSPRAPRESHRDTAAAERGDGGRQRRGNQPVASSAAGERDPTARVTVVGCRHDRVPRPRPARHPARSDRRRRARPARRGRRPVRPVAPGVTGRAGRARGPVPHKWQPRADAALAFGSFQRGGQWVAYDHAGRTVLMPEDPVALVTRLGRPRQANPGGPGETRPFGHRRGHVSPGSVWRSSGPGSSAA